MKTFQKGSVIGTVTSGGNVELTMAFDKPDMSTGLIRSDGPLHRVVIERADVDDAIAVLQALRGNG